VSEGKQARFRNLAGKHILVVEDDAVIGTILTELLRRYDHASHADSGKKALHEIDRDPPDIILLDLQLSDMSGLELARSIRRNQNTKATPILAMSGSTAERRTCVAAGCDDFIVKPFALQELLERLSRLLRRKRR
jgi:DNA-binding response OmpR family regulator